jgi:hypothetical protein
MIPHLQTYLILPVLWQLLEQGVMWSSSRIKHLHLSSVKGAPFLSSQPAKQTAKQYSFLPPFRLSSCRCILQSMTLFFFSVFRLFCIECKNCTFIGNILSFCHYIISRKWKKYIRLQLQGIARRSLFWHSYMHCHFLICFWRTTFQILGSRNTYF